MSELLNKRDVTIIYKENITKKEWSKKKQNKKQQQ